MQEDTGTQQLVKLFAVHQLSTEPAARFKAVFQERAQWSWQDLQPYVEDLQACAALCLSGRSLACRADNVALQCSLRCCLKALPSAA